MLQLSNALRHVDHRAVVGLLIAVACVPVPAQEATCSAWCTRIVGMPVGDSPPGGRANESVTLELTATSYRVDLYGPLAVGTLVQEFVNPQGIELSATTEFLAPRGMRVDRAEIETADRSIALAGHEKSAKSGEQPSLVGPGGSLDVKFEFRTTLPLVDGSFRLRLPTATAGADVKGDSGLQIVVNAHDARPLAIAESRSHEIAVDYLGDHTRIDLLQSASDGRDFELAVAVGAKADASLVGYVGAERDGRREVMAVLTPPIKPAPSAVRPKQVLFVLDTSGSMKEGELDQARSALADVLVALSPNDLYNIVEFNDEYSVFSPVPVSLEQRSSKEANAWLNELKAGGGSELLPALVEAMEQPQEPDRHSMIVVLTDGAVHHVAEVLQALQLKLGDARLFIVGIGDEIRRDKIVQMANFGRGTAVYAETPGELESVISELFGAIGEPLAWDLKLDLGHAQVEALRPERLPDLYAGRAVEIRARVSGDAPESIAIIASTMSGERRFEAGIVETSALPSDFDDDAISEVAPEDTHGERKR